MYKHFCILLVCGISLVNSVPPLQLKDEIRTSDLFHRHYTSTQAARYRLPSNVKPTHYVVNIRPILDNGNPNQFDAPGDVSITVLCEEATNTITLHSIEIAINENSVKVTDEESGEEISVTGQAQNNDDETYTFTLGSELVTGKVYKVYISYTATVLEELRGLYRSKYTDSEGQNRWLATTQFEDIDARRAFPCFDEPAMKATFDMNIGYNEATGYHALCNMDEIDNTDDPELPGWKWSKFRTSVKMPTYLVAIIVSDFIDETAPPGSFGEKLVKTWGQRDLMEKDNSGAYSALTTAKHLSFYEEYFAQTYDLNKMDSVAIPDFPYGAMENWGLITYRINYLLYFQGETTESSRRSISSVIAHEVAHQWFGNIVTMQDWNDLWLNEGFSTYVERMGSFQSDPEFDSFNFAEIDAMQIAMEVDAGATTLPVSTENSPSRIIYEKGSSIIRMMEGFLTEPTLKKGLRNYIQEKKYGNAAQDDLFRIVNEAAQEDGNLPGLTIKEIMDTWTLQTGYPLVRVTKASSSRIFISQERFNYKRLVTLLDPNDLWWVPVTYATAVTPTLPDLKPKLWLPKNVILTSHSVDTNLNTDWILVNPDGSGYYRVLYETSLNGLLKSQLDTDASVFSSKSRSQLLDDYFTFANDGYVPIQQALNFTTYLSQEDTLDVWNPVLKHFRVAYRLLSGTDSDFAALSQFFSAKLEKVLETIGPEQTPDKKGVNVILRANLLDWACGMKTETCRAYAAKLYALWMESSEINPIPTDLKPVMQCAGVYLGGENEWEFAKAQFGASAPNSADRQMWLNSMACSSNAVELKALMTSAFQNEDMFTKDEAAAFIKRVAANSASRDTTFEFLEEQLGAIITHLGGNVLITQDLFAIFAQYFNRQEHVDRMTEFISANGEDFALPIAFLNLHVETVKQNVEWMSTLGNDMISWFSNNSAS